MRIEEGVDWVGLIFGLGWVEGRLGWVDLSGGIVWREVFFVLVW